MSMFGRNHQNSVKQLFLNLKLKKRERNELSKETQVLTNQETLLGRVEVDSRRVREPRRTAVSDSMVMGLVSGLSLANRSDLGFFLVLCALLSQEKDSGRLVGPMASHLSPFDLSQIILVGGSLLVLRSLPGPPVVKIIHESDLVRSGSFGQSHSKYFQHKNWVGGGACIARLIMPTEIKHFPQDITAKEFLAKWPTNFLLRLWECNQSNSIKSIYQ